MPVDPSFFSPAPVQLPDPMAQAQRFMALRDLLQQAQVRQYVLQQAQRADAQAEALNRARPAVLRAGYTDESIMGAPPEAQGPLLKEAEGFRKSQADLAKTRAETKEKVLKIVGGNAYELSNDPTINIDKVGNFVGLAQQNGVDMSSFGPMPHTQDPRALSQYMKQIANLSVSAPEMIRFAGEAESRAQTKARDLRSAQHMDVEERQGAQRIGLERTRVQQERLGQPFEATIDGKQAMLQLDKQSGNLYDFNTGALVRQGSLGPKQNVPEGARNDLRTTDEELATIRRGVEWATNVPSAFSMKRGLPGAVPVVGRVGESLAGRQDKPAERQARAYIFNNVSGIIHARAGTAQSPAELAVLNKFLPGDFDEAPQIIDKLRSYEQYLLDKRNANPASRAAVGGGPPPANPPMVPTRDVVGRITGQEPGSELPTFDLGGGVLAVPRKAGGG